MSDGLAIGLTVVLLALNGFFVGAEFAMVSARRTQIEPAAREGSWAARTTIRGMADVSTMMAACQLGITMCSLGIGALGEPAVAHQLEPAFHALGLPDAALHITAFIVAMLIVVYLHMVIGEMVPKNFAIAAPERAAMLFGPPLVLIATVLRPLLWLVNAIANVVLRIMRVTPRDEVASTFTAAEVPGYLSEAKEHGLLEDTEVQLLSGALRLSQAPVRDVLVPRASLVALPHDVTVQDAKQACIDTGFSRFPLQRDDRLIGYIHLKDLLDDPDGPLETRDIRPLTQVPADATLEEVLAAMRPSGAHIAEVIDGDTTVGAAMLEDVIEAMVGIVDDTDDSTAARSR